MKEIMSSKSSPNYNTQIRKSKTYPRSSSEIFIFKEILEIMRILIVFGLDYKNKEKN